MRRLNLFWFFLTGLGIFLSVFGLSNLPNHAISASEKLVLDTQTQRLLKPDISLESGLNPFQHGQPVVLSVQSGFNQWQLPVLNQRDGWLISVGYAGQRDASIPLKMRFESVKQKKAGGLNHDETLIPLVKLKRNEALTRHRVARPKLSAANKSSMKVSDNKQFMIQTRTGSSDDRQNYETITATAVASGLRATVYVDQRDRREVSQDVADAIVRIMDDEIPAKVIPRIGDVADTDGNGRLQIVMTQVLDRMADGKLSLDGFVRPSDFDPMGVLPVSHASDLIFLNRRVTEVDYLKSLLAHEFTHAVAATRRQSLEGGNPTEEESWLEEGLAHLSERWMDGSWQNLGYRISAFYRSPEKSRLVVNDQVGLRSGRAHGHRGASFSFLNWCESEFGENLPTQLMDSQFSGVRNLENATGESFETLFRHWSVQLMREMAGLDPIEKIRGKALLGDWLAGTPWGTQVILGKEPAEFEWQPTGTSLKFFELSTLESDEYQTAIELSLQVENPDEVQITAIPVSDRHRGLNVSVVPLDESLADVSGYQVQLVLENLDASRPLKLQAVSWETASSRADAESLSRHRGFLDTLKLAHLFGAQELKPGARLVSPPIRISLWNGLSGPTEIAWKIVTHDSSIGRPLFSYSSTLLHWGASEPSELARGFRVHQERLLQR